jgi:hypothetical protein
MICHSLYADNLKQDNAAYSKHNINYSKLTIKVYRVFIM